MDTGFLAGRRERAEAKRQERYEKLLAKAGNRYRVEYDIDGPRVRLGVAWFAGAIVAFMVPAPYGVALYFAGASGAAAAHAARTWRARGHLVDRRIAFAVAAAAPIGAAIAPPALGLVILGLALVAVAQPFLDGRSDGGVPPSIDEVLFRAGTFIRVTLPPALAAGTLTLLADLELWAAVSLVVIVSAYEAGDYLIGSGSATAFEGPAAGVASALVFTLVVAALGVPPFNDLARAFAFGAAAAVLAPAGQLLASAILPHARAYAPGLRRLDSLLLAAPVWYASVDLFVL